MCKIGLCEDFAMDTLSFRVSLNNNLRLLQMLRLCQIEEMLDIDGRDDKKGSLKVNDFTMDCFSVQNTEASCHVLYLLCQCFDYRESQIRFRDVWPIYDKKVDSLFRRVVSVWLKEIISNHPQFFEEVKLEALGFLLVNPGGDRFIQLIECFVNLVMHCVMSTSTLPKECAPVYKKPKFFHNSSILSQQILVLMKQTRILVQDTTKIRKQMLKDVINARKRYEKSLSRKRAFEIEIEQKSIQMDVAHKKRSLNVNLDPMVDILEVTTASYYIDTLRRLFSPKEENFGADLKDVDCDLITQLKSIANEAQALENLCDKYKSVWYWIKNVIGLKTPKPKPRMLDIGKLYITTSSTKPFNIGDFIDTIKDITQKILDDERLKQKVPEDLLLKFKKLDMQFKRQKICRKSLEAKRTAISINLLDCDHHMLLSQTKSNNQDVDWSILSELNVPPLRRSLLFTPSKKSEFDLKTGYTPRIINFLQAQPQTRDAPHPDPDVEANISIVNISIDHSIQNPHNISLLRNWSDEKGIMDISMGTWANESSDDE